MYVGGAPPLLNCPPPPIYINFLSLLAVPVQIPLAYQQLHIPPCITLFLFFLSPPFFLYTFLPSPLYMMGSPLSPVVGSGTPSLFLPLLVKPLLRFPHLVFFFFFRYICQLLPSVVAATCSRWQDPLASSPLVRRSCRLQQCAVLFFFKSLAQFPCLTQQPMLLLSFLFPATCRDATLKGGGDVTSQVT